MNILKAEQLKAWCLRFLLVSDSSQALFIDGRHYIFLNENQSPQQQWQDFCHELSHVLLHTGDQFHMYPLFREYQEFKVQQFYVPRLYSYFYVGFIVDT
ncbi:ImmA/IrrE family metallo-endopeptidase [Lysinibacillus fusiformis]